MIKQYNISGILLGVFDGHGGSACAQVISQRLLHYIAVSLLPEKFLKEYIASADTENAVKLLETFNNKVELVPEIRDLYKTSFKKFLGDLMKNKSNEFNMEKALSNAFLRLDNDLSREALAKSNGRNPTRTLAVAMSGAVAIVAHIDGPHLHVASAGDCQAVLGICTGMCNHFIFKLIFCSKLLYNHLFYFIKQIIKDGLRKY